MLWLRPLAYWIPFVLALYLAMISIMVILRKQWVEHERLVFPVVQVPLAMIQDDATGPSLIKPFFKNPLMWLGFAIPAILQSLNGLNPYFPSIPRLYWGTQLSLFGDTITIPFILSFQMLGFSYFVNRDVLFGLCFFHLLNVIQQGIFAYLGIQKIDPLLSVYTRGGPMVAHQGLGAFIVLVLFGLWTARGHLRAVLSKALQKNSAVDDSDEILSYRAAVLVLAGSLLFMGVWIWQSGLPGLDHALLSFPSLHSLHRFNAHRSRRGDSLHFCPYDGLGLRGGRLWDASVGPFGDCGDGVHVHLGQRHSPPL